MKVVGYAMNNHMRTSLVRQAIDMAVRRRLVEKDVTIFLLQPGQSVRFSEVPGPTQGLRNPSVGQTGVCWDNDWAEPFNATLKNERVQADGVTHEGKHGQRYFLVD